MGDNEGTRPPQTISLLSPFFQNVRTPPADPLQRSQARVAELEEHAKRLLETPSNIGYVMRLSKDRVVILGGGNRVEVARPSGPLGAELRVGMSVKLNTNAQITALLGFDIGCGDLFKVKRLLPGGRCEIETPAGSRVVMLGEGRSAEPGDKVIIDMTATIVLDVVPHGEAPAYALAHETGVTWDSIGGLEEAKAELREAVEGAHKHREMYERYGKKPLRGVLLFGPPGTGKTMLGKAAATAIAQVHGAKHVGAFLYVKGPELLDKFMGATEVAIRGLFDSAREHMRLHGYPAIIFIDEADALLSKRGAAGQIHSHAELTVVPQFLSEMDGMDPSSALVMLATNRADTLDPAIVRDGRIDRKILVPRPSRAAVLEIFLKALGGKPTIDKPEVLAEFAVDRLFSDRHVLAEVTTKGEKIEALHNFTLGHIVSGAMVVGVVDRATSLAIARELRLGGAIPGIARDDMGEAIKRVATENREIDHGADFSKFCEPIKEKIVSVRRLQAE